MMNKVGAGIERGSTWEAPSDFSVVLIKPSRETLTDDRNRVKDAEFLFMQLEGSQRH